MQGHQQASQLPSDIEFLQAKIQDMTPVDVWNLVRMKILPYFTPWDYVCDRTRVMATKFGLEGGGGNNGSSRSGHQNTLILFAKNVIVATYCNIFAFCFFWYLTNIH